MVRRFKPVVDNSNPRLRSFVVIVNVIFLLGGLVCFSAGVWLKVDPDIQTPMMAFYGLGRYDVGTTVLLVTGLVMCVTGIFACIGSVWSVQCALLMYFFVLLLLVLIGEIGSGIWALSSQASVHDDINKRFFVSILRLYGQHDRLTDENDIKSALEVTAAVDYVQQKFSCCGVNGPSDYSKSLWSEHSVSNHRYQTVPDSCCRQGRCNWADFQEEKLHHRDNWNVFKQGCSNSFKEFVEGRLLVASVIGVAMAVVQLLGAILVAVAVVCFWSIITKHRRSHVNDKILKPPSDYADTEGQPIV